MDGSVPVRLGDGLAVEISPDKQWALALRKSSSELVMLPLGRPGESQTINGEGISAYQGASWFPDGKRIVFAGSEKDRGIRLYIQDVPGGTPHPITREGFSLPSGSHLVDPSGASVLAADDKGGLWRCPVDGRSPTTIPNLTIEDSPIRWSRDGRFLFVFRRKNARSPGSVTEIQKVLLTTGARQTIREIRPPDALAWIDIVLLSPDEKTMVYGYSYDLSDLYLVEGLR
jgi:hypothetical protein